MQRKSVSLWDKATLIAHGGLATTKVMWFPNWFKVFWVLLMLRANDSDCIRAKDHGICQGGLWGTLLKPLLLLLLYFQIIYFVVYHSVFDAAPGGHFYAHLMCFSNLISSLVECYALTQRLSCFKVNVHHLSAYLHECCNVTVTSPSHIPKSEAAFTVPYTLSRGETSSKRWHFSHANLRFWVIGYIYICLNTYYYYYY